MVPVVDAQIAEGLAWKPGREAQDRCVSPIWEVQEMIKLATMTSVCPDWTLDQAIDGMKRHGYKGLEPRTGWEHRSGIEPSMSAPDRERVRRRMEEERLEICCIATGAKFATPDADELLGSIEEAREAIDLAGDLGASLVRTFGGFRGTGVQPPLGGELIGIVERTVEAYKRVIDHAAERGVTLLMETHDFWSVSAQVREVVERVDHPNLRVLWDIQHPQRYFERPDETFGTIGHLTAHLHAHDGVYESLEERLQPRVVGEGIIDHATPLRLLHEAGFDGYFSIEHINKPGAPHDAERDLREHAEAFRGIMGAIAAL